ncbi:MAG: DUF1338 domain-containing protein [Bacteroidales bacterium]|nr:DUF1338 domain-containing protein [Bacteroidales bacterium]HOI31758.1 DUF1338 domain-containing protein [Bacteroidales bacterium]
MNKVNQIFDRLWAVYTHQNPSVQKVYDLFVSEGETIENDHIAFRTFDDPRINIDVLSRVFLEAGYKFMGDYHFESKHLYAKHFEMEGQPRVFISQLITADFSPFLQETVKKLVDQIPASLLKSDELIYSGTSWVTPSYEIYEKLREESEYAAWLYVNGFCANHFTVSVNGLKKYDSMEKVNQLLKDNGFRINDSGGEIKGNPAELLEQSSIRAEMIEVNFTEGIKEIPGCYYEFARRYPDQNGKLYSGFIAKSADKIFESTDKVS